MCVWVSVWVEDSAVGGHGCLPALFYPFLCCTRSVGQHVLCHVSPEKSSWAQWHQLQQPAKHLCGCPKIYGRHNLCTCTQRSLHGDARRNAFAQKANRKRKETRTHCTDGKHTQPWACGYHPWCRGKQGKVQGHMLSYTQREKMGNWRDRSLNQRVVAVTSKAQKLSLSCSFLLLTDLQLLCWGCLKRRYQMSNRV